MSGFLRLIGTPVRAVKNRLKRKIVRAHLNPFMEAHSTEESVLDLGCGTSRYAHLFPNRVGVDIVPGRGVHIVADAHALPLQSGAFSVVLATEMLEHMKDPQRVVDEIERVLKPGGRVILTTRFMFPIHEAPYDYFRFTHYGLAHLFRNWKDVRIEADTRPFEGIAVLFQRMAFQSDFYGSKLVGVICLLVAQLLRLGDRLIKRQYGDYGRRRGEPRIITSGYYVVAVKAETAEMPALLSSRLHAPVEVAGLASPLVERINS